MLYREEQRQGGFSGGVTNRQVENLSEKKNTGTNKIIEARSRQSKKQQIGNSSKFEKRDQDEKLLTFHTDPP